jgi:MtrB/PioB family decaheme-associated outer membrane protein
MKRDMNTIIAGGRSLLLGLCLPLPLFAATDTTDPVIPASVDKSDWSCEYCLVDEGISGELEVGGGYVSDGSFKFGEYNGLYDDGAFVLGSIKARYRDGKGGYLDLRGRDLGIDSRMLDVEGGQQGSYRLFLNYNQIPHYTSDSAQTPYLGAGSDTLLLPSAWVRAGTTAGMTQLNASLHDAVLQTERKRLGIGVAFIPARKWETAVNVRHEVRDGQKRTAGSIFFTNTAQLIEPVDYTTDEVEVSATYTTRQWQSKLAYYGSFFNDHNASLTWQNAYPFASTGSTDFGRSALPPDNQFHQILLSSGYQLSERTRVSGDIAMGRMEQDASLLPATINTNVTVALPRQSADAKVDTLTANLKINSAVSNKLRLNAAYRYNDRDNRTPVDLFTWVSTDANFTSAPLMNQPYSFTDNTLKLDADYRLTQKTKIGAGYEYEKRDRTNLDVDNTNEDTFWGKLSVRAPDDIELSARVAHAERDASGYNPVNPTQNPLLRKYNMADRNRDTANVQAGFYPHERLSIGLNAGLSVDDYSDSALGLTGSREIDFGADASMILTDKTSLHAFASWQKIKSDQAGSQSFATADWFAKYDDTIDNFGIGVKHRLIRDKLDIGADYALLNSTSEISVQTGVPGAAFPDLKTELDTVKLYADYHLKDDITLHAAYWYENYDSRDWSRDGVDPATISNVLGLGEDAPSYDVHVVMVSVRYLF